MQLEVLEISSPLAVPWAEVQPFVPHAKPLRLVKDDDYLLPLFPECCGQLVLITEYSRPIEDYCGSGFPGEAAVNIMARLPPEPELQSLWLGWLTSKLWPGEPFIETLYPVTSPKESQPRRGLTLSEALHRDLATSWPTNRIMVYLGTGPALTALQGCCKSRGNRVSTWAVAEAVMNLGVRRGELAEHAPLLQVIADRFIREVAEAQQARRQEYAQLQEELAAAKLHFELEERRILAQIQPLNDAERIIDEWVVANGQTATTG